MTIPTSDKTQEKEASQTEGQSAETPSTAGEGVSTEGEAAKKPAATPKWFTSRIDELTSKWRSEQAETEKLRAELKKVQQVTAKIEEGTPKSDLTPEQIEAQVEARALEKAAELADIRAFNAECNKIAEQGREEHEDFDSAIKDLRESVGISRPLIEAAVEVGDAHKILYALSQDKDEADRILKLPAHKQGVALAKFASKIAVKPKAASKAPPPIVPKVGATGRTSAPDLYDEGISSREWFAQREKELAEKRKKR